MKKTARKNGCSVPVAISLVLACVVLLLSGCTLLTSRASTRQKLAVACARHYEDQGYDFDPVQMTCDQMCERVAAMRRADHWADQGHSFDPNSMTAEEMDRQVDAQIFRQLARCMIWYVSYAQSLHADGPEL